MVLGIHWGVLGHVPHMGELMYGVSGQRLVTEDNNGIYFESSEEAQMFDVV